MIDKIEQETDITGAGITAEIRTADYTITPLSDTVGKLKTNPGKTLNSNGINFGADPATAKEINEQILEGLKIKLISNTNIEYCLDAETNFKLVDSKLAVKTFATALTIHSYKAAKLDFKLMEGKTIATTDWKGIKGYKKSRGLKLYSKYEEQQIQSEGDYIRLELVFGARAIEQNGIGDISNVEKARHEISEFLNSWEALLSRKSNRYSYPVKTLINIFRQKLGVFQVAIG